MDNTVIVQRANVILKINPQQLDYYLSQGYSVINERGEVIQASVPRDLGTLQKAYIEHTEEIKALKAEIQTLKEAIGKPAKERKRQTKKEQEVTE